MDQHIPELEDAGSYLSRVVPIAPKSLLAPRRRIRLRTKYHSFIINADVSMLQPATRTRLADLQQYFLAHGTSDPAVAMHSAVIAVGDIVRGQATIMAYADCFGLLGAVLLCAVLAVVMLRRGMAAGGAAH
jgi:DHA2 family multidrug resistance protein